MAVKKGAAHEIIELKHELRMEKLANERLCEKLVAAIPTTWLDPILTGPEAVVQIGPLNGKDVERVLWAVRERVRKIIRDAHNGT